MPQFVSKHKNLRLIRKPQIDLRTPTGAYVLAEKAVRYDFSPDGVLNVEQGDDLIADGAPIRDEQTNAVIGFELQDALEWLRGRPEYNEPAVVGGFTEVGRERDRIPDAAPRVREIMAAVFDGDVDALVRFREEEADAPYSRPAVDEALAEAFSRIEAADEPGTDGYGTDDGLDGLGLPQLREAGRELGLSFPPGTSKEQARQQIRDARGRVAA